MDRREYKAVQQCAAELQSMLEVDTFLGAAISVQLVSTTDAQRILKEHKSSKMGAVLRILQVLEKKRKCLDLLLAALRKSVEGCADQQHSHFQLITVLVRKKEELKKHAWSLDDSIEASCEQMSDSASALDSISMSTETDSNPPLDMTQYTEAVTKARSLPRSQSESQCIRRRHSRTLPQVNIYPSPTSHDQPSQGWVSENAGCSPASSNPDHCRRSSSAMAIPEDGTHVHDFAHLLKADALKRMEVKVDQFKDNIETRMVAYEQFFKRQEAELKEVREMIAQLMRENERLRKESKQLTLDVADVDIREKEGEGVGDYPMPGNHHGVPLSKEASNDWHASYPRPTSKKGRSSPMRPASAGGWGKA